MRRRPNGTRLKSASPRPTQTRWCTSNRCGTAPSVVAKRSGGPTGADGMTSLGRAYLAAAQETRRNELFALFHAGRTQGWSALLRGIASAIEDVRQYDNEVTTARAGNRRSSPLRRQWSCGLAYTCAEHERQWRRNFVDSFDNELLDLANRIRQAIEIISDRSSRCTVSSYRLHCGRVEAKRSLR